QVRQMTSGNSLFFFKDFEKIIPGPLWGVKEPTSFRNEIELDYMHFKFKGHQILADSLQSFVSQNFKY
ncbi:MAG: hypothetical protein ACKO96_22120, partial [Flammeovirgaceae bacterium]